MTIPLVLRLGIDAGLTQADEAALERLCRCYPHEVPVRGDLVRQGDEPHHVRLILDGWACRYKITRDGQRQIVGLLIPGDFCDLDTYLMTHMDHSIGALTRLTVAQIAPDVVEALIADYPRIARAFRRHALVHASIQREWLLNMGQRPAFERLGHLMLELFHRLRAAGLAIGDSFDFPLTQTEIADATGLTTVHVNRTLQELRRQGLIMVDRKRVRLPDLAALNHATGFDPGYLHLPHDRQCMVAGG